MVIIQISLYDLQREKRLIETVVEIQEKSTPRDLIHFLGIPIEDVGIVVVNGKSSTYQQTLKEGDHVTLIPLLAGG